MGVGKQCMTAMGAWLRWGQVLFWREGKAKWLPTHRAWRPVISSCTYNSLKKCKSIAFFLVSHISGEQCLHNFSKKNLILVRKLFYTTFFAQLLPFLQVCKLQQQQKKVAAVLCKNLKPETVWLASSLITRQFLLCLLFVCVCVALCACLETHGINHAYPKWRGSSLYLTLCWRWWILWDSKILPQAVRSWQDWLNWREWGIWQVFLPSLFGASPKERTQ